MTHRVNAAVFRIGKSLNWHSLGLPLYRFRDLRVNLFLNYFLSRFLIREHYRMVRYGVRSEARFLKISIIAFRLMDTRIGASGTFLGIGGDVFFETYWVKHYVFRNRFKQGVFWNKFFIAADTMPYFYEDVIGAVHRNKYRTAFSVGPFRKWDKLNVYFLDGMNVHHKEPRESVPGALIGFNLNFYIKLAAKLMVLRYAVRKSALRLIRKKILPQRPRVFKREFIFLTANSILENYFSRKVVSGRADWKFFLIFFLTARARGKAAASGLKNWFDHLITPQFKRCMRRIAFGKKRKSRVRAASRKLKGELKKKYLLFKRYNRRWGKWAKKTFIKRKRIKNYYSGRYYLRRHFSRLIATGKNFKHTYVYGSLRKKNNKLVQKFFNYNTLPLLKKNIIKTNPPQSGGGVNLLSKGLVKLLSFCKAKGRKNVNFLLSAVFKRIKPEAQISEDSPLGQRPFKPLLSKAFFIKAPRLRKGQVLPRRVLLDRQLFKNLWVFVFKRAVGASVWRNLKKKKHVKIKKKFLLNKKIKFFSYFFLGSLAAFKFYRLKLKADSLKYLYRRKKLIFFFEKKLSVFLKTPVMLKFFNPLEFTSIDDVWVKSLFDSLGFVSNLYLREKLDYKPTCVLSLYTMLAFKYGSPAFLGSYIANQLEWRWRKRSHMSFIRILIYFFKALSMNTMYTKNLVNFSIGFYGKIWGKLRAGKYIIRSAEGGGLPLRRVSLKMDTSFTWAESQFGTFGIRIWIARV